MMTPSSEAPTNGNRDRLDLDGTWSIQFQGEAASHDISVPSAWQAQFTERWYAAGTAVYARRIEVPQNWRGKEVAIVFGAVNYIAEVLVNGRALGRHEGGYLPFEFVLPADVVPGPVDIEVRVTVPSHDVEAYPDFPFNEIPHGKQSWYGLMGGIWQSVCLECRDAVHVAAQRIRADLGTGEVGIECDVTGGSDAVLAGTVLAPDGAEAASFEVPFHGGTTLTVKTSVDNVRAWSPEDPALYRLVLQVKRGGAILDRVEDTFGFRTFEAREGSLFLNGRPFYLRGALDQDYYPDGAYVAPTLEFLEDQAKKAKELGLNLLRCHIKVPDPRYYEVADRFGLLVWSEIPNVQTFTDRSAARLLETMQGILRRDGNHPSIVIWTLINEDWGTRLVESGKQRDWLAGAYAWLKQQDPTRLVVDNSACIPNFHVASDIDDYHAYAAIPEEVKPWNEWVADFAARPDWSYSPNGDAVRSGREPLVVSEFGVWGLPDLSKQLRDGKEPHWFETGLDWGSSEGVAYPHGFQNRFNTYRMDKLFGSMAAFCEATQWHQFKALKFQIEEMRRYASIQGYVITELTDLHWEANGLMDLDRNPRIYHDRFHQINADVVIVPRCAHYSTWSGDRLAIDLDIATGGSAIDGGAMLHWTVDGTEQTPIALEPLQALSVRSLDAVFLVAPETANNRMLTVSFRLLHGDGVLAENSIEIAVLARRPAPSRRVHAPDAQVAAHLSALGYTLTGPEEAEVRVVQLLDSADIAAAEKGARYLVLADGVTLPFGNLRKDKPNWNYPNVSDRSQAMPQMTVVERKGTIWQGNWITGFSWIKRSGAFATLPGGPLIDMSFAGVMPSRVLSGFRNIEYDGLVQAGMVSGWLHKPCALIARRTIDAGHVVATTFGILREAPGADPMATALLDCLVESAAASA